MIKGAEQEEVSDRSNNKVLLTLILKSRIITEDEVR